MSQNEELILAKPMTALWKRLGKNRFLVLGLCGIVALLALQLLLPSKPLAQTQSPAVAGVEQGRHLEGSLEQTLAYRLELQQQLKQLLASMAGVGEVQVMISLGSGSEAVPAMNLQSAKKTTEERDKGGGTRLTQEDTQQTYPITDGDNRLLLLQEKLPPVTGVVIVAQGAEDAALCLQLARAVQTICNLPMHLVQVLPGK